MLFLYCSFIHRASLIDDNSYNAKFPKAQVNFFFYHTLQKNRKHFICPSAEALFKWWLGTIRCFTSVKRCGIIFSQVIDTTAQWDVLCRAPLRPVELGQPNAM